MIPERLKSTAATPRTLDGGANVVGGTLTVDASATLAMNDATITGTAITNHNLIDITGSSTIAGGSLTGGNVTIESGQTLTLDHVAVSDATITFATTSGTLKLDDAAHFAATISGFTTTDGLEANSDQIDLTNIKFVSLAAPTFDPVHDTLTVSDGTDSAVLQFTGSYVAANFKFAADGNGGTIVYDPPVSTSPAAPAVAPAPVAAASGHRFVFNFANTGHDTSNETHHANDAQHPTQASALAAWSATHDPATGGPVAPDAHDAMTSAAIIKAQLHAHDFHFV